MTLLHYLALRTARAAGIAAPDEAGLAAGILRGTPSGTRILPIFVPLAAYDDHIRRTRSNTSLELHRRDSWCSVAWTTPTGPCGRSRWKQWRR